jgi:hypothetical protein
MAVPGAPGCSKTSGKISMSSESDIEEKSYFRLSRSQPQIGMRICEREYETYLDCMI